MSNEAPTDVLRLVPVEPTEAMLDAVKPWPEHWPPYDQATVSARSAYDIDRAVLRSNWTHMLAAAPASPLPGGGWKPVRNDVARRCDPKAWEFYDRHIDNPIMGAECRAEVAASIRMADAILALPAAPIGDA